MTTGTRLNEGRPTGALPVQAGSYKFDGRHRRKFRRACCCITFLLIINMFLLMHTAHSVKAIMWFMMNGSYTYDDTTYLYVPGGAKTLCNDLCIDMCIINQVDCELNSCLNVCNQQMIDAGNYDDFQTLPQGPQTEPVDAMEVDMEPPLDLVDTPPTPDDPQSQLDQQRADIEALAEKVRGLKAEYAEKCEQDPDAVGCGITKEAILNLIELLNEKIDAYNSYAIEVEIDIKVEVWMVDVEEVTAEP